MIENLILFTITPVQKFITTARKTEDLWLGSYILSYLNATAINQLYAKDGVQIIYPSLENKPPFEFWESTDIKLPTFPNLFLALSKELSIKELTDTMEYVEASVQCEFEKMARHAVDIFVETVDEQTWDNTYADQLFRNQVKNFFQLYWVVSSGCSANYKDWYAQTGTWLASAKNCRAFPQINESGRKCSLCGEREIFPNGTHSPMEWWKQFVQHRTKYCRQGEALCTICLTKRLAREYIGKKFEPVKNLSFPSTSEVSTADIKSQIIKKKGATEKYEEFVKSVQALKDTNGNHLEVTVNPMPKLRENREDWNVWNIDGDWLFEDAFSEQSLERSYGISRQAQRESIEQCTELRRELIHDYIGHEPTGYFAVIVLDGDGMGQIISQAMDPKAHTEISGQLNDYTTEVRKIVEQDFLGKLIYAGGDDVLALANLSDLLEILHRLRWDFPNLNSGQKPASTASAGVCIAHHKMPLGDVLRHARTMEKAAKSVDGKNALGIALLKHSGNISQTVFKWKYEGETPESTIDTICVSQNLVELIKSGEISKKFLYVFREVFARLSDDLGMLELPGIVETEFKRLIRRAMSESARSNQEIQDKMNENVEDLTALLTGKRMKFSDFVSFLEVVNFIAREGKTE